MRNTRKPRPPKAFPTSGILDDVLQLAYPREHRIERPRKAQRKRPAEVHDAPPELPQETPPETTTETPPATTPIPEKVPDATAIQPALAIEIANCLWYMKTQHFKQAWRADETVEDDPRSRRALSRINRGIKMLADAEINLIDPTGERYPPGAEGLMRPIQFEPTAGMTVERVAKTIRPIILQGRNLIQRGEVLVAVPLQQPESTAAPDGPGTAASSPGETASEPAAGIRPVAEQEASPATEQGASPAAEQGASAAAEQEVSPAAEQGASPAAEQVASDHPTRT